MGRFVIAAAFVALAVPALAQSEMEISCGHQADVMKAVQQARLDNVREKDVQETILAGDPAWPDNFDNAIEPLASFVYQQEINVVRKHDLSEPLRQNCIEKWDETKDMLGKLN